MWKGKSWYIEQVYYLYISETLHRLQVKKASEELGPILVQHTSVPERSSGQTKLYQVTRDDGLAPPWGDTLDLVWAVTFITSPSASLSSSALTIYMNICLGFLTSVLDRNSFNHKWLSTDYFYFPCTALSLVVLRFSIGKTWNKHK